MILTVTEERLWGLSVATKDRGLVEFAPPEEGPVGVREPRRPGPPSPSQMAELAARFQSPERRVRRAAVFAEVPLFGASGDNVSTPSQRPV